MDILITLLPLTVGWLLDRLLGDPERLPHPIVWFGKCIALLEHRFNRGVHRRFKGAMVAWFLSAGVFALSWQLFQWLSLMPWLSLLLQATLIFYCLAGHTLITEVRNVFKALDLSLDKGRQQVGRIVGRDTTHLSAQEIRTAALETLAENLSDGVIAPLFWYALLGVPGMLTYKMINTLDSMIGYRNARYREFGCVAARIDDVANYLPARITALLMVIVAGRPQLLSFVLHYGKMHASPNSGYPEAALAGILNCRFGGTHNYFGEAVYKPYIGSNPRPLCTEDMHRAVGINIKSEVLMVLTVMAAIAVRTLIG